MSKVRVAFFADILIRDFDGASRTIYEIIDRIPPERFEFAFFCGLPPKEPLNANVTVVQPVPIPVNKDYNIAIPVFQRKKLIRSLNEFRPDVIHISTPSFLGFFALNYGVKNNIPVISIYHTHFISYIEYYLDRTPFLKKPATAAAIYLMRKFYNRCNKVLVPTEVISRDLIDMDINPALLQLWPRGINTGVFHPGVHDGYDFEGIISEDRPNILFASRLVWEKNLKTLIALYKYAGKMAANYNFIIAGDGLAYEELKSEMPDAVFTGQLERKKLAALYAACDVFVFPSITETFGNVVAEAMASGLPCVIADGGGSSSLVRDGVNGFKCMYNNPEEYFTKINIILTEPELRQHFIQKGIEYASKMSWTNLTLTYFEELSGLSKARELFLKEPSYSGNLAQIY
ncbi:MAG: glycosyltransferase family 1 protein [Saprospiraceae bacterium]|nr:glycosyltransferase family 1 protein [Saprospiraceae bacterium]